MRKVNNDSMSPPRAMTLQGAGGREPPAGPARHHAPLNPPLILRFIKKITLIRLYLLFLRVISYLRKSSLPQALANLNFPKRPLVKLKAAVNVFAFRTSTLFCDNKSLLVNAVVQLFVVAKCVVCVTRVRGCGIIILLLTLSGLCKYSDGKRDNDLHIGGIFPMEGEGGWQGGQACKPAAELALLDVNARSDLLSGFKLLLHSNDSKVINKPLTLIYLSHL